MSQQWGGGGPLRVWWSSSIEEGFRRREFLRRIRRMVWGRGPITMWRQGGCSMKKRSPGGWGSPEGGGLSAQCPSQCEGPHPRPHFPPGWGVPALAPSQSPPSLATLVPTLSCA